MGRPLKNTVYIHKQLSIQRSANWLTPCPPYYTIYHALENSLIHETSTKKIKTVKDVWTPSIFKTWSSLKILGFALYFQLLSVFGNRRKSSYSCLNFELLHTICHTQYTISYHNILCPTISYYTIYHILCHSIYHTISTCLTIPCYTIYSMLYQLLIPVTKHSNR